MGRIQLGQRRVNTDGVMVGEKVGEVGPKAQVKELPKGKESRCPFNRKEGRKMERRQLLGKGVLGEGLSVGLYFPCERQRQCQWKERWKWVWEGNF